MPIYELTDSMIRPIDQTTFAAAGISERGDLQRLLRERIDVISPHTLISAEEFGEWEDSQRRIDLLGIGTDANLVVIELKRTEDGGHMELQAIRYAAMVSTMTYEKVLDVFGRHLRARGQTDEPEPILLEFLGWDEPNPEIFAQDTRIVLAAAEFSKELTSAVLWLNERDVDFRCVRLKPYVLDGRLLVDAQQVIPLPETAEYQIRIQEKARSERAPRDQRQWDEASFMADLESREGAEVAAITHEILSWIASKGAQLWWGKAMNYGSVIPILRQKGKKYHLFKVRSDGVVAYQFDLLRRKPEFAAAEIRETVLQIACGLPGLTGPEDSANRRPRFPIRSLRDPEAMATFKSSVELMLDRIEASRG